MNEFSGGLEVVTTKQVKIGFEDVRKSVSDIFAFAEENINSGGTDILAAGLPTYRKNIDTLYSMTSEVVAAVNAWFAMPGVFPTATPTPGPNREVCTPCLTRYYYFDRYDYKWVVAFYAFKNSAASTPYHVFESDGGTVEACQAAKKAYGKCRDESISPDLSTFRRLDVSSAQGVTSYVWLADEVRGSTVGFQFLCDSLGAGWESVPTNFWKESVPDSFKVSYAGPRNYYGIPQNQQLPSSCNMDTQTCVGPVTIEALDLLFKNAAVICKK